MAPVEEPRFTIGDLAELTRRERAARGETPASAARNLRARLEHLRAAQEPEPAGLSQAGTMPSEASSSLETRSSLEARVAALEEELKRLRDRIEEKNG